MWYIGLLLCLVAGSRQLTITEFAVPTSIQAGEDAHFKCKYGLKENESDRALFVKWWWKPLGSEDRTQLYQRIAGHPADVLHTNIHVEDGDNIKITDVGPSDAGTYECEVSNIDEIRVHANMTVFTSGDGPELNITEISHDNDGVSVNEALLSCTANDVAPEPDLIITVNGEMVDITVETTVYENLFNVSVNATAPLGEVEGAEVSCELVYADANITHPLYKHTLTYYSDSTALSTTASPEESTTTDGTSVSLENESGGAVGLASYVLLVVSAFSILMVVNN